MLEFSWGNSFSWYKIICSCRFSNWGDLPNADLDSLAVPLHRVQYFKYKDTKVWDRQEKLDVVFGSTSNTGGADGSQGIVEFMNRVDDRIRNRLANKSNNNDDAVDSDDDSDYSDSDDDDVNVNVSVAAVDCRQIADKSKVNMIPEEERSTHFLAVRITEQEIRENVDRLQQHIVDQEEELSECCMSQGLLHMTLGMLRLKGQAGEDEAVKMLDEMKPILQEFGSTRKLKLRIQGLDTFGQRVLYGKVHITYSSKFSQNQSNDHIYYFIDSP